MARVHQMRAGAPDKICLWTDGSYELVKHDNTNLVDYTKDELIALCKNNEFILPADEGDIRHANNLFDIQSGVDQSWILLPQTNIGEGYCKVIDYNTFIPKDSNVYRDLYASTSIRYASFATYSLKEFKEIQDQFRGHKVAFKTSTGSGSRGVWLVDEDRVSLGGKYVKSYDDILWSDFHKFAEKENCRILVQALIPNDPDLAKVNVDFVIKEGKLLGYKWDRTDPSAVFTNWNFGWTVRSEFTDFIMETLVNYLVSKHKIWNAIMNFEAFSNMTTEIWLVEFNWRYSNSMFEGEAAGIDLIGKYLRGESFEFPKGEHKFSRFWQCKYYKDIENYSSGK